MHAAEAPVLKATSVWAYDWTGFYFGGHAGYSRGRVDATVAGAFPIHDTAGFGALYGGVHGGYNYLLPSGVLVGIEADASFPNYLGADDVIRSGFTPSHVVEKMDFAGSLRGRIGYVFDRGMMIFGTGGLAYGRGRFTEAPGVTNDEDKLVRWRTGWAAGAGAEVAIAQQWTARFEYLYSHFGTTDALFPSGTRYQSSFDLHALRAGLSRKLGDSNSGAVGAQTDARTPAWVPDWEVHAQVTYIQQGYGRFRSPYIGENSFTPWPQTRNTATGGAYLGVRLWQGGELYYNPELLQGFGLHDTTGAAGFPNGEAQKSNFPYPHYNTSRLFLRQTFGLGGAQETLESGPNQLSGKVDISRVTVQVGKFAIADVLDQNAYARDTRKDFMNWSVWAAGAFDYSADKVGLTYGALVELNQKYWALRSGYFLMPVQSNANNFDMHLFQRGSYVVELETRYSLFSQPGKLRSIAWVNSVFAGSYRDTLDNPALNLDIAQTRTGRVKYGYVFNVEQSITDDVGLFGRWSWNDGKNEIMAFTDIDSSLSGGVSIKGKTWGRADDTVGIGGAINAISRDHRDFLAAGGLGILVGDGRLNYRTERVLETYYTLAMVKNMWLTFDYQLLVNPAYNADRGPISIYSMRYHAEW